MDEIIAGFVPGLTAQPTDLSLEMIPLSSLEVRKSKSFAIGGPNPAG